VLVVVRVMFGRLGMPGARRVAGCSWGSLGGGRPGVVLLVRSRVGAVEGYHRTVGNTSAVHARLRRMWDEFEVALAQALADADDTPLARADHRLEAAQLTTLVRLTTSQEVRTLIGGHSTIAAQEKAIRDWINHAATRMRNGLD